MFASSCKSVVGIAVDLEELTRAIGSLFLQCYASMAFVYESELLGGESVICRYLA